MKIISKFFKHNWLATIYINFRMLPFSQAYKLPIDVYHGVTFNSLSGNIKIVSNHIFRGLIKLNARGSDMFSGHKLILDINGSIVFHGQTEIGYGTYIYVGKEAELEFGNNVRIGALNKIFCQRKILFGNEIDVSWESQIFDTNFHYIEDSVTGERFERDGEIIIGNNVWFGNRVSIMKGTIMPDDIIIASNSLVNKDYSSLSRFSMLAGTPAKIVKTNTKRLFKGKDI